MDLQGSLAKTIHSPPPVFPLIPVFIPMIIDLADGMTPETDLIITRNVDSITGDVTGGM